MIEITLVSKSKDDKKPTVNTNELIKLGLISPKVKIEDGDVLLLKIAPIGAQGILADQEFKASRNGATLMAKDGWNTYLFGLPKVGNPIKVNCAGVFSNKMPKEKRERVIYKTPSKTELKSLLKKFGGNQSACAKALGVSPRTFGRFLDRRGIN